MEEKQQTKSKEKKKKINIGINCNYFGIKIQKNIITIKVRINRAKIIL